MAIAVLAIHVAGLLAPPHMLAERHAARPRSAARLRLEVDDDLPRVRFRREDADAPSSAFESSEVASVAAGPERRAGEQRLSVNDRLKQRIDASVARLPRTPSKVVYTPTDLNGVQPWAALAGGLLYSAFAYGAWITTSVCAEWFTLHPAPQDIYAAQRVASIVRTVIIGLTSMFAGISAVTSVGMYGLFARVTYGVLTGELDPKLVADQPSAAEAADAAETDGIKQALDVLLPREWRR